MVARRELADCLFLLSVLELTPEDFPEADPPPVDPLVGTVDGLDTGAPVPPVTVWVGSFFFFPISFDLVINS